MTNTLVFLFFGGVIVVYMSTVFVLSLIKKDNSIVDIAWGLGFVMLAWVGVYGLTNMSVRELALAMLVTVWGMRLAVHIFLRNRGKGEDFRYKAWRESWGKWFVVRSFFQIYMLQGFLMLLVASSFIYTFLVHSTRGFGVFEILGTTIFAIGFLFEAVKKCGWGVPVHSLGMPAVRIFQKRWNWLSTGSSIQLSQLLSTKCLSKWVGGGKSLLVIQKCWPLLQRQK
jgi:steroid 5-alpha reductase family enzyme